MKRVLLILICLFSFAKAFSNSDKEIVIIKVEYSKKKDGFHSKLMLDLGKSNTHPLYNSFQNEESGAVTYKDSDGKQIAFTNEIDLMNFLFTLGYKYKEVYEFSIMTEEYYNFVLVKEE